MNSWEGTVVYFSSGISGIIKEVRPKYRYTNCMCFNLNYFTVEITSIKGKVPMKLDGYNSIAVGKLISIDGRDVVPAMIDYRGHAIESYLTTGIRLTSGEKIPTYRVHNYATYSNTIKSGRSKIISYFGVRDWLV